MATLEQLQQALIAADKAGASDDARRIAQAIMMIKAPQAEEKPALAHDPGAMMTPLIAAGRTFDRIGKGMQQLYYGATGDEKALGELKARAAEEDRLYQPLRDARPIGTGIGEALPSIAIPAGGGATLLANMGRMAVAGALPGALEYGSAGERAGRAVTGAIAGASVPALVGAARTAKSFAEPLYQSGREKIAGRLLNRVTGDSADAVAQRLSTAGQLVPGSAPTAGQVAESGGIAALERALSQANPEAYTNRAMEQASARLQALRGIAGDDAAMSAALGARDAAAGPLYAAAKAQTMQTTPELAAALARLPNEVMGKAQRLAKLAGEPLKVGEDIPAKTVLKAGFTSKPEQIPAQVASYSGKALHYIKLALSDSLEKTGESALGKTEKRLMSGALDDFLSAVDSGIPAYGQAREAFATLSKPVNQMEIGQVLLEKAKPALSDYGGLGKESAATFAQALRNGDDVAARVLGRKGASIGDVLSPQQMQTLTAVAQDLARKSNAQDLGRGIGSDTFQKIAMSNIAEQSGVPRVMGGLLSLPGVNRATRWIYEDADRQMQGLLSEAMLNPQATAKLMKDAKALPLPDNPKTRKLIEQALLRSGLLAAPSAHSLAD